MSKHQAKGISSNGGIPTMGGKQIKQTFQAPPADEQQDATYKGIISPVEVQSKSEYTQQDTSRCNANESQSRTTNNGNQSTSRYSRRR
uniref:Uncharacterized protein n=1 Tax=Oryza brachyantha TaxID=4533 RepID=J3MSE7_ORYBR